MKRYFVEYKFKTPYKNQYWFPLFIKSKNLGEANRISEAVVTALKEHYEVLNIQGPRLSNESTKEIISTKLRGNLSMLEMNVWRIKDLPTNPSLNFEQHLELLTYDDKISDELIARTISKGEYPAKLYYSGGDFKIQEFLLINVMDVTHIEELYVVAKINPSNDVYSKINLAFEGQWIDSHNSGFKIKVDAPHNIHEDRYVHIAHPKLIIPNERENFDDDSDKNQSADIFDFNFARLERAKEIACKELDFSSVDNLRLIDSDVNVLVKNAIEGIQFKGIIFLASEL